VVLMHWILPPHLIPVVEVAPGVATDDATVEAARELLESIGKWPIYVRKDIPGYLLNRLQFAILREAMHLVGAGIATPEEIDRLVRGSLSRRWPVVGLFRQADMAGLDVYRQIFGYLAADLDAGTGAPSALTELVEQGRTGAQAGHGFYRWEEGELGDYLERRNRELVRLLREDLTGGA
jgi:3-hydroxybutyryl-CoA dehydrogenase